MRFAKDTTGRPDPWARVYAQPKKPDDGVDFELQVHAEFPFLVSVDRPWAISSSISEGRP